MSAQPHPAPAAAHTPEPWRADEREDVSGTPSTQSTIPFAIIHPGNGYCIPIADICAFPPSSLGEVEVMRANAARIVTAVNACSGIPDPASAIPALIAALEGVMLRAVRQQANGGDLLDFQDALRECADTARAALALAKGGA